MATTNTQDLGKVALLYKGEYDSTKTYEILDFVADGNSTWFSKQDGNKGNALPTSVADSLTNEWWGYLANGDLAKAAAEAAEKATAAAVKAAETANSKADLAATNAALAASKAATAQTAIDNVTAEITAIQALYDKVSTLYSQLNDAIAAAESAKASAGSAANPVLQRPASVIVRTDITAAVGTVVDISPESVLPSTANASMVYQLKSGTATVTPDGEVSSDTAGSVVVYVIPTMASAIYAEVTITFRDSLTVTDEAGDTVTDESGNEVTSD